MYAESLCSGSSAYNLALRAGALINSGSGSLVYVCMLPDGALHGPPAYVLTTFSRTLTVYAPAHAYATSKHVSGPRTTYRMTYSLSQGPSMHEVLQC